MRGLRLCAAGGGGAPPRKTPDALAGRCFCGGWQVTYQKTERPLNVGKVRNHFQRPCPKMSQNVPLFQVYRAKSPVILT